MVARPTHDSCPIDLVPATTVITWPVGTFVENLVARVDGSLVVSIVTNHELALVRPGAEPRTFAKLPAAPTGLTLLGDELFVNVGEPGTRGWSIYRVDRNGTLTKVVDVPDALFLNGSAVFRPSSQLIVVDAILGRALLVDVRTRSYSMWLEHELLGKCTREPMMPGVNGVKCFRGHVYFTSTERSLILRTRVASDGSPSDLEVLAERFVGDDFALDANGNMYVATHVHNQVQRMTPDGARTVIAGPNEGMYGSTAVAFGRTPEDRGALYVTTTGGMIAPIDGRIREARLVRLDVGVAGAPLEGI